MRECRALTSWLTFARIARTRRESHLWHSWGIDGHPGHRSAAAELVRSTVHLCSTAFSSAHLCKRLRWVEQLVCRLAVPTPLRRRTIDADEVTTTGGAATVSDESGTPFARSCSFSSAIRRDGAGRSSKGEALALLARSLFASHVRFSCYDRSEHGRERTRYLSARGSLEYEYYTRRERERETVYTLQ